MGLPEQWLPDDRTFHDVNAVGSENVTRAARAAGARRLIHTSTIDVFHANRGTRFDESQVAEYPKGTAYERSKQEAERLGMGASGGGGGGVGDAGGGGRAGPHPRRIARGGPLQAARAQEAAGGAARGHGRLLHRGCGRGAPARG